MHTYILPFFFLPSPESLLEASPGGAAWGLFLSQVGLTLKNAGMEGGGDKMCL